MQYASLGTVSHGTMRLEDLIPDFAYELEHHIQRNADEWCSDEGRAQRDKLLALVGDANELEDYDSKDAGFILEELFAALDTFSPPYAYFGAHPGDGSDYGFWLSNSFEEGFDGLKVSDTSEVPENYCGEVLHVNDHGNCTLYMADKGGLTEIWGIV